MKRRSVVKTGLGAATFCIVPVPLLAGPGDPPLARLLAGNPIAIGLGRIYARQVPQAASFASAMLSQFEERADGRTERTQQSFEDLRTRQFASEDVVVVDGWVLARSEAELCAMAAEIDSRA